MKIKEITVSVKLSKNYNTYESSTTATIEEVDDVTEIKKMLFTACRQDVIHQQEIEAQASEMIKTADKKAEVKKQLSNVKLEV